MKLQKKSSERADVDITDFYAVKLRSMWSGIKGEGAAFWLVCTYLVFEYVRPQNLHPVIDILPWAQISLILACVTAYSDRKIRWVGNPGNSLFMTFFVIVILSGVLAFSPSAAWENVDIIINWVIVYFLIITVVNSEKRFIVFMLLYLIVNFKMSQFGARDFAGRGFSYSKWGISGAPGWFKDAGDLGIQMTIFIPLSVAFVLAFKDYWGRYKKMFFYLLPISAVFTLIGTSARGPQLGLAAAGIWFLVKSRNIKALVAILVTGLLLFSFLPDEMLEEYQVAGEDSTSRQRLALWSYGLEIVQDHPILGVGYYNWKSYCNFKAPDFGPDLGHCLVAHNTYITAAAETGILGLGLYLSIALFMFIQNASTRRKAQQLDNKFFMYTAHALDGGLIAYIIGTTFFTVTWYPIFYIQLAMTVALHEVAKRQLIMKNGKPERIYSG